MSGEYRALAARVQKRLMAAAPVGVSPIWTPELVDGLGKVPSVEDLVLAFTRAMYEHRGGLGAMLRAGRLIRVAQELGHPFGLTAGQLLAWLDGCGLRATTQRIYLGHLREFYAWAVAEQLLAVSPMDSLPAARAARRGWPPAPRGVRRSAIPRGPRRRAREGDQELIDVHLRYAAAVGMADQTIGARRFVLTRLSLELGDLLAISQDEFTAWLGRPGWSAETRSTYFKHYNALLRWCVDTERLVVSPLAKMRRPRVPRHLPRPAPLTVYRAILADGTEPWLTLVLLAALAGLRISEICRLRREHVTEQSILVSGKGGKAAEIPTHARIWAHVKDWPPGWVMPSNHGHQRDPIYATAAFGAYLRRLGLAKVTPHQFRHLYATQLLRQTGNLRVVQKLLRHESIATTAIYTEVVDEERRQAITGLDLDGENTIG